MSVATLEQQLAPLLAPRAKVSLKRGTLVWTLIVPRRFSSNRAEAGSLYLARSVLPSSSGSTIPSFLHPLTPPLPSVAPSAGTRRLMLVDLYEDGI